MDNSITKKYWSGIYRASDSFALIWHHPELFIYLGSMVVLYFIIELFLSGTPFFGFMGYILALFFIPKKIFIISGNLFYLLVPLLFAYFFVITCAQALLVQHTLVLLYNNQVKDKTNLFNLFKHIKPALSNILLWSAIITLISLIFFNSARLISGWTLLLRLPLIISLVLVILLWTLTTFFVIPLIAIHSMSLRQIIKKSWKMAHELFFQILGAQSWMIIVIILTFIPLLILFSLLCTRIEAIPTMIIARDLITLVIILCGYIILAAQTILKTILYYHSIKIGQSNINN